jgi:hypothetical protein
VSRAIAKDHLLCVITRKWWWYYLEQQEPCWAKVLLNPPAEKGPEPANPEVLSARLRLHPVRAQDELVSSPGETIVLLGLQPLFLTC